METPTDRHIVDLAPAPAHRFGPVNQWVEEDGRDYAVIDGMERMAPFFLSLASAGDHWFFCSSTGTPSVGRKSPDHALFPYDPVDKILDNWNATGPWTALMTGGVLWEPMRPEVLMPETIRRRLRKSVSGDELVFEEHNESLGFVFSYRWQLSQKFGFVRRCRLENLDGGPRTLRLVDGLDNLVPPGVSRRVQSDFSNLANAYKLSELELGGRLLVHRLAAGITDLPVPLESLEATTVWTRGLGEGLTCLSRDEAVGFLRGEFLEQGGVMRGRRGAFFVARELNLEPGEAIEWLMVADLGRTQPEVSALRGKLADPAGLEAEVLEDVARGHETLRALVGAADGIQRTADRDATLHHYHNTLCNILRGGVPEDGYTVHPGQFANYLGQHNEPLREEHAGWLATLPGSLRRDHWLREVASRGDRDLERLALEYLPLVLSRRHGDPSRPWNRFEIRSSDETGHYFEGNWRDIFQNWEALAWSYPGYLEGFLAKFLNASTADGFNPYRITAQGVDWEVPDPSDPWSSTGYWGDHQIVYLLKFLELLRQVRPGFFAEHLDRADHVFADVPYRLKSWEDTLADPRHTVRFDRERHKLLMGRKAVMGGDGLLLRNGAGDLERATLAEKLLLPAATKLANLVPGGGIWMNTQRPEWNDANNALAGCGLSVVTAAYLHRYLALVETVLAGDAPL